MWALPLDSFLCVSVIASFLSIAPKLFSKLHVHCTIPELHDEILLLILKDSRHNWISFYVLSLCRYSLILDFLTTPILRTQVEKYPNGNFVGPTVINNMTTDMDAYKQEIFGPVLCVINVDTLDDAIELINRQIIGIFWYDWIGYEEKCKEYGTPVGGGKQNN